MKPAILGPFLVALAVSGCQSMLPQPRGLGNGEEEKAFILKRGIDQVRDPDTDEAFHVICEACAKPTIKTQYLPPLPMASTRAPTAPVPANPIPVLVQKAVPVTVPTSVTESAGRPGVFKHLVPFAFGRSKLGPQGRSAMDDLLAVAKEAERLHVRGYTDIIGKMPGNRQLAMARAVQVRTYLIDRGIPPGRISTSYCIDCFSESNETVAGRTANRRAAVLIGPTLKVMEAIDLNHRDLCRSEVEQR
jgi:outer membrane protein OmpA-like peptidoglycan-associated protein